MEKLDLENFPVSESAKNMIASVSDGFYDNSYVGKWLYEVMGQEYDTAREIAEDILNQLFPETATWGLMYHEIKWGLPVRENLPYEERRQLIYRKRDYLAPMTPYRMEGYLKTATGFDVRIADINDPGDYGFVAPHPNVFKAYFMGEGTLASKRARAMLNELKQSHTMFTMNDRTEIASDNRNLEEMNLKKIIFHIAESFWYSDLLDGRKLLDGSTTLFPHSRYDLVLGFKYLLGETGNENIIELENLRFASKHWKESTAKLGKIETKSDVSFWKLPLLDGSRMLDGTEELDVTRNYLLTVFTKVTGKLFSSESFEASIGAEIPLRTEETGTTKITTAAELNYWNLNFLDGRTLLDGTDTLDYSTRKAGKPTIRMCAPIGERDNELRAEVITKTWNYRFLDGSVSLNGSRNLDSIYRKEQIQ